MGEPKILVVDDAHFMRHLLGGIIKDKGYGSTYFAEDGYEAVEKAGEIKPDIVTLDISMPRMDGLEAIEKILGVSPSSKIIMVSAAGAENIVNQAMQNGAVAFIKKPFDRSEVCEKLDIYLK